ncbi:MAG: short-chain fatty acyl-CoA regulator family protein [Pseudomonadota bacterium]
MPRSALTGSRIRERRVYLGLKQAGLAESCGISPSYLNLIEHNRRRIGGKLLNKIATVLGVEPSALSEGADLVLLDALRNAADRAPPRGGPDLGEAARAEEFAGRFPGWARLIASQGQRIAALERTVELLNDRLTHDPFLSASLHDVLSTVTAIHSASGILADGGEIDADWQARFHRNIFEDSARLAEASRGLVNYLDAGANTDRGIVAPPEELEAFLDSRGHHVAAVEAAEPDIAALVEDPLLTSAASRALAADHLTRARADAIAMPLEPFSEALGAVGPDPAALASRFGVDLASVFRRIAALPSASLPGPVGLVICDASGTLTFRRPVDGFPLPRFGAACPLLPLYLALTRPMAPVRAVVEQPGRDAKRFLTYAVCQTAGVPGFDGPPVFEASMLILPADTAAIPDEAGIPVGTSCRICPRPDCAARREPTILSVDA